MSYTIKATVESYDVQPNGNIKISSLLKLFQKAAGDELLSTPFNSFALAEKNIAFVITKMTLKMLCDVKIYDELEITTYPRKIRGVSYPRDFIVKCNGKNVVLANSVWVLIDLEKRHVIRPTAISELGEISTSEQDTFVLEDIRRILKPQEMPHLCSRRVEYSYLDMNNHLNNTFYSDFIFDSITCDAPSSDTGMYLQINYKNEARYGNTINIHCNASSAELSSNELDFAALIGDKICFTAYLKRQ